MTTGKSRKPKGNDDAGRSEGSVSTRRGISLGETQLPQLPALIDQSQEYGKARAQSSASPQLRAVMESLSLAQYLEPLVNYGINSWEMLLDIQEDDMEVLKFKLGHRRKLQREIATRKNNTQLHERLDTDGHTPIHQLVAADSTPLPIRIEKRRQGGQGKTTGTSKRQSTSTSRLQYDRSSRSCQSTFTEGVKGVENAPQNPPCEVQTKTRVLRAKDVVSNELPGPSDNVLDMGAMAMSDLLDWNPIISLFESDWIGYELPTFENSVLSPTGDMDFETMSNIYGHQVSDGFSHKGKVNKQYISQPVSPHDYSRDEHRPGSNENLIASSQDQTSGDDNMSAKHVFSYASSMQDSSSSSRSYSVPSADSESEDKIRSESMSCADGEIGIDPIDEPLRYTVSLDAPTAIVKFPDDDSTTYLNRGQTYSISIVDTAKLTPRPSYRTSVGLSFQDTQHRQDKRACWQTWSEVRGLQFPTNQSNAFQAVELVDPAKPIGSTSPTSKFPTFELLESSLDGFAVHWHPAADASRKLVIALRFNFVSTDFTFSKGASNIAVRLCVKTEILKPSALYSAPSMSAEICYCKLQILREHGAARKQSNDLARVMKKVQDLEGEFVTVDSQSRILSKAPEADRSGSSEVRSTRLHSKFDVFGEVRESELQSLLASSKSSRPTTSLHMRGENLDDPDSRPFPSTDRGTSNEAHKSRQASSPKRGFPQVSAVVKHEQFKSSPQMQLRPERALKTVSCIYIQPKMSGYDNQSSLHLAIYLRTRTLDNFIQDVARKCNMRAEQILRIIRVNSEGVETVFNHAMVCELESEQAMVAEFKDIGLPPDLHPSFADAAGFETLKSRFFELKLIY